MRSRDRIKNGGGPHPKHPILQVWKKAVNTMLFLSLKKYFLKQYIGSKLSNNTLFVNKL
jgi:hypothetical protein